MADETVVEYREPSKTYRLNESTVAGKLNGIDAVKQSVYHILNTERYSNPIYSDDYGIELEQYLGADYGTIVANIENTLNDALKQDDRIESVVVTNITRTGQQANSCLIEFTVNTVLGNYEESINVVQ